MIDHTLSYGRQYITDEDIQAVVEALKSDYLTQGPKINKFEKAFAEFCDSKYACVVSNGTAALHLCAMALGITPGDKIQILLLLVPMVFVIKEQRLFSAIFILRLS